jgi:hypothetical protein
MVGAWLVWPEVGAVQQEAPEEPYVEDEADDQPHAAYRLDQL